MTEIPRGLLLAERLEKLKILEFDEEIFSMSRTELRGHFKKGTSLDHTRLLKNMIWQDYNLLQQGELEPFRGNIRSYWYRRAKPVLFRARAKKAAEKYDSMINQFSTMVQHYYLFSYQDFGFLDQNRQHRLLGTANAHIFVVAEKVGHFPLLTEIWDNFGVTVLSLGGMPSVLSTEYFLRELEHTGFGLDAEVSAFFIVDFDPAGYSIAENFLKQMRRLGYRGQLDRVDLVRPDRMTNEQLALNKFRVAIKASTKSRVGKWVNEQGGGLHKWGFGKLNGPVYGIEADAMTWDELIAVFAELVSKSLDVSSDQVVEQRLTGQLVSTLQRVFLRRHFG